MTSRALVPFRWNVTELNVCLDSQQSFSFPLLEIDLASPHALGLRLQEHDAIHSFLQLVRFQMAVNLGNR